MNLMNIQLDPLSREWYQSKCQKEIDQSMQALRADQSEEDTRRLRVRIKVLEEVMDWSPNVPSPDAEITFY